MQIASSKRRKGVCRIFSEPSIAYEDAFPNHSRAFVHRRQSLRADCPAHSNSRGRISARCRPAHSIRQGSRPNAASPKRFSSAHRIFAASEALRSISNAVSSKRRTSARLYTSRHPAHSGALESRPSACPTDALFPARRLRAPSHSANRRSNASAEDCAALPSWKSLSSDALRPSRRRRLLRTPPSRGERACAGSGSISKRPKCARSERRGSLRRSRFRKGTRGDGSARSASPRPETCSG